MRREAVEREMKAAAKNKLAYIDEARANGTLGLCRRMCLWWRHLVRITIRQPRRLRLCESLPLGDRRFVAVIEFEKSRFLVGGTSSSLALLARLSNESVSAPVANEPAAEGKTNAQIEVRVEEGIEKRTEEKEERR
jgi:flagellar biogenesis protein FliO